MEKRRTARRLAREKAEKERKAREAEAELQHLKAEA
jgi:hypothetical protein